MRRLLLRALERGIVKRPWMAGAVLWVACLAPTLANAGVLRGTLDVSRARARFEASRATAPGSRTAKSEPLTDAVVYVEAVPEKVEKKLAKRAVPSKILQQGGTFFPRATCVPVASAVTFLNQDRVYHNIFSVSPARRFDIGKYGPGETRSVTFTATGPVQLFCELHPEEIGFIYVTPNHAYTRPNTAGEFTLPKLPAGKYVLRVWHPAFGSATKEFEMPKRGDLVMGVRLLGRVRA